MILNVHDEEVVRAGVALRAQEFGDLIGTEDVTLHFFDMDIAPGCQIFRANWGGGESCGALSGLIRDKEQPDTYPMRALSKIFRRWLEADRGSLNAKLVAKVSAFLLDPLERHAVILNDSDIDTYAIHAEWLEHIHVPQLINAGINLGIEFWWTGYQGASLMRIYLDENQSIKSEEVFLQDTTERIEPDTTDTGNK